MFNAIVMRNKYILIIFIILFTCVNILFLKMSYSIDNYVNSFFGSPPNVYRIVPEFVDEYDISILNDDEYFYGYMYMEDANGTIYVIDNDYKNYIETVNNIKFDDNANYIGNEIESKGFFDFDLIQDNNYNINIRVGSENISSKDSSIIFMSKDKIEQSWEYLNNVESNTNFILTLFKFEIGSERYNQLQNVFSFEPEMEFENHNEDLKFEFKTEFVYIVIGCITFICTLVCSVILVFSNSKRIIKILYSLGYSLKKQTFTIINIIYATYIIGFILAFLNSDYLINYGYYAANLLVSYVVIMLLSLLLLLLLGIKNIGRI